MAEHILVTLKECCIEISKLIRQGDSENMETEIHSLNKTGDQVKKLDIISNEILKDHLIQSKYIRAIASEEDDDVIQTEYPEAPYLVCFDPLDGSTNIGVNITVGTIFAIYKYNNQNQITNGHDIEMAGYCLYGGSTQLIIADAHQHQHNTVRLYMLYEDKDFILLNPTLKIPNKGNIYSINESNRYKWLDKRFNDVVEQFIKEGKTTRWVGSLVADAHRTLLKGGFFSYPSNQTNPDGKLRLLYEVYPFAFIFKVAGGCSSDGDTNILDIPFPTNIHQKISTILSSKYEMDIWTSLKK